MKFLVKMIPVLCMATFGVHAGTQTGKVETLYARASDNLHLVTLSGGTAKTGSPSCAIKGYWLNRGEKSIAGKSQISRLLAAK
ncbi:hypothetical protein CW749_07155 [Vibrio sp. vnigr-6D03]|uniref:hypothetical protein n=1 Tax=Vibrio sp. vnigr-6D03 TaxID=2058088 RepID=UPI000C32CAB8|nr:hypothetical protein [Vibrio sp. vnigr-6D03]PKF80337.1 hypothetical protein CW749_07155 [Vibrio sp. vnigr-6D03]